MGRDPTHANHTRRSARVRVAGRAIVHADEGVTSCALVDVSLGGLLLQSDARCGELPRVGDPVSVELHLATSKGRWYDLSAHVTRRAAADRIVVVLDHPPPDLEDDIEEEVLAVVEAARAPRVVVVDSPGERRAHVAEAVRRASCQPIEVSTPLEAIEQLEECRTHAAAVIVSEALTQTGGCELARYLQGSHPEVRIAVIRETSQRDAAPLLEGVVELAPEDCDRTARVRDVLGLMAPVV
jgi:hypothetical protein